MQGPGSLRLPWLVHAFQGDALIEEDTQKLVGTWGSAPVIAKEKAGLEYHTGRCLLPRDLPRWD